MKVLVYTFRTFTDKAKLEKMFGKVFIFGKLNADFEEFSKIVIETSPRYIIGVARADKSRIESLTVNQFNKKRINKDAPDKYLLYIPDKSLFRVSSNATTSFCNWTAYKTAKLIDDNNLKTQLIFIHVNESDIDKIGDIINDR